MVWLPKPTPNPNGPETADDSLVLFLAEVRRHQLLTALEEIDLAKRVERGDMKA